MMDLFLQTRSFLLCKMLIDGLESCGLLYQLFGLIFWRHPFTAEDPLVSIFFNFSKTVRVRKVRFLGEFFL